MSKRTISFTQVEWMLKSEDEPAAPANRDALRAAKAVLRAALERELTSRQRDCVRLYFYEGLTQEETALALGITKSTVCRHLQRAKNKLGRAVSYGDTARRAQPPEE